MSVPRQALPPAGPLYRLGRLPDPLAWPPLQYVGDGRFDDPLGEFRALYAAEQRPACFIETLYRFRRPLAILAAERALSADEPPPAPLATLPPAWWRKRAFCRLRLEEEVRWLDLRSLDTREALRPVFASLLAHLQLTEFDLSAIYGPHRVLTQGIARWAYEWGYAGLRYGSRYDEALNCWTLFERLGVATFRREGDIEPIAPDDPDLLSVATLFGLTVSPASATAPPPTSAG